MSASTTEPGAGVYPHPGHPCFHPADEPSNSVSPCFHPGDEDGEPVARHFEGGVSPCFHPDDYRLRFQPGDEDALAESRTAPVNVCRHPADDLAADLHLSLTGIDERQLAVLAGSRP